MLVAQEFFNALPIRVPQAIQVFRILKFVLIYLENR